MHVELSEQQRKNPSTSLDPQEELWTRMQPLQAQKPAAWSTCAELADTHVDEGGREAPPTQDEVGRVEGAIRKPESHASHRGC